MTPQVRWTDGEHGPLVQLPCRPDWMTLEEADRWVHKLREQLHEVTPPRGRQIYYAEFDELDVLHVVPHPRHAGSQDEADVVAYLESRG